MKTIFLKFRFILPFMFVTAMAITSCKKEDSKDVSQDKIYAEYELSYDKNTDKTYASAIFKFSNALGTNLQLTAPSEVKFGADVIPYDPVFAYYRKEYAGLVSNGTFTFKDKDGVAYTNTISSYAVVTNPAIDTISKSSSYTYTWVGTSVAANEAMGLTIANLANQLTFQYFYQNAVGSTNIILSASQLNNLPTGMAVCHIDRVIEKAASSVTSAGGKIRGKYRALDKNVYIKN